MKWNPLPALGMLFQIGFHLTRSERNSLLLVLALFLFGLGVRAFFW